MTLFNVLPYALILVLAQARPGFDTHTVAIGPISLGALARNSQELQDLVGVQDDPELLKCVRSLDDLKLFILERRIGNGSVWRFADIGKAPVVVAAGVLDHQFYSTNKQRISISLHSVKVIASEIKDGAIATKKVKLVVRLTTSPRTVRIRNIAGDVRDDMSSQYVFTSEYVMYYASGTIRQLPIDP